MGDAQKGSFIVFHEWLEPIEQLSDEDCGRLFRSMIKYSETGEVPSFDGAVGMAFAFIRPVMDRNAAKWSEERRQRSEAGRLGGIAKARKYSDTAKDRLAVPCTADLESANLTVHVNERVDVHDPVRESENDFAQSFISEDKSSPRSRFSPPSLDDVRAYIDAKGFTVDAEAFVAYYQSKGWKVGSAPMKDWHAAVVTWQKREQIAPARPSKVQESTADRLARLTREQ